MNTTIGDSDVLDTILETLAALVVVMDSEGRVMLFNDACEELTGYRFSELEGRPMWELLIPEEEREAVVAVFDDLRAGNFPNQFENDWLTRDGERRLIEWSNSAVVDDAGDVELVISTGVDVTERRKAEEHKREVIQVRAARKATEAARDALRLSEKIFSGIVDLCADAIISIDKDQKISLFNQGAEEIFGYAAADVLGKPLAMLLPDPARAGHQAHVMKFADSQGASQRMGERGQIYGMRKNGELFPAEASISKQKVEGEWLFTAVLRDVTEEQEAREKLKRTNEELHRSNADLEQFAAVASHDLQEPLRKIQSFGERLESKYKDLLPRRGQDYLDRMQNAAGRMSDLIGDLLEFSRISTRARPFETISLAAIIDDVLKDLEVRIERSEGRVEIGELPELDADPFQMRLLFQNLIGNALKFHREGVPPVVEVDGKLLSDSSGEYCQIVVADNGVGFEEKYLDRIFDVFQRLHGRGAYEGTGMGLAIVRKIVERHGGTITATSLPDQGARFIITLPVHQLDSEEETGYEQ